MNDIVYYATRGRTYSEIVKGILSLLICAAPFLILLYFGKVDLFSRTGITLMCFTVLLSAMVCFSYTDRAYASIYHPIVRISDEYLILDFDRVVLPWDYIKEVEIVAYTIFLTKKREKWLWNGNTWGLSGAALATAFIPVIGTQISICLGLGVICIQGEAMRYEHWYDILETFQDLVAKEI